MKKKRRRRFLRLTSSPKLTNVLSMVSDEKKEYEVAFLAREEATVPEIARLLRQHEADINLEGPVKKIALAYKIGKELQAYFGYFEVRIPAERVAELGNNLRMNKGVMRCLIVTKRFVKPKEQPLAHPAREFSARETDLPKAVAPLSNEDIERKIDEILK